MKTISATICLLLLCFIGKAQETEGKTINVSIDNITNDTGKVLLGLHTESTFMKGPGVQNLESTIKNGKVSFTFENVKPGTYAIIALHDKNENQRMDFDQNGMPLESYGTSGNDMSFGPPNFAMTKFEVKEENLEFDIRF